MPRWFIGPALLIASLSGCAGVADSAPSAEGDALLEAEPLPIVDSNEWSEAQAGCEGALGPSVRFGIAAEAPELVVALDEAGSPICVDSFPAVEAELAAVGLDPDTLWMGYLAALQDAPLGLPSELNDSPDSP